MKLLPLLISIGALALLLVFSPQHRTMPRPGDKLGTADTGLTLHAYDSDNTLQTLKYRSLAFDDMAITLRDSVTTGHTVDGVGASPDGTVCIGEGRPYLACRQSIERPTIPDVLPMWTISFDEGGTEG